MSLRLIIEDDEGSTTVVPLASDAITIGRQQGNTIQLTEKNVSRQHARLFPESDGWIIEDLGSYNGIKVNNDAVEGRTKLREGDVVEIGDYHLAITEDVDKSPLNFRSGQAANDGAIEPMLVSSSADLPRLSAEEIAALQSGQQPVTPAAGMMADSGAAPASPYHGGYAEPESNRRKAGLFVILGLVFVGVAALGIFWFLSNERSGDRSESMASTDDPRRAAAAAAAAPPATSEAPAAGSSASGAAAADGAEPAAADSGSDAAPAGDDGAPSADDGSAAAADGGEPAPDDDPEDPQPKPRNKTRPKQKPKPKPAVDVDQLIADARQKAYKEPANAYRLAKQAYNAKPSITALWVMGPAACRLKDRSKANWVLKRLKGADKTKLKDICADKGLEL